MLGLHSYLTAMLVITPPVASPAIPPIANPPPAAVDTLATARDAYTRMTVRVMVNGQGPFAFAIDTGSESSAISRSLADRLALPTTGQAMLHGMAGAGMIDTVRIDHLAVGLAEVGDIRAPVLADQHLGVAGLLGLDGLADKRIVMDFERGTITVMESRAYEPVEPGTIVVQARRRFGQLILADADIDGERVLVIVDSGAQTSIGNSALRERLQRRGRNDGAVLGQTMLIDVAGREMPVQYGVLSHVRIGGVKIQAMPITFADAHPFTLFGLRDRPALMLGMDILRCFRRVSVDFGKKRIRFRPEEFD